MKGGDGGDTDYKQGILPSIIQKLARVNLWHFVWVSVILSEIFTAILNIINSIIFYGKISYDLLLIGVIDAFFVALIVSSIVIFLIIHIREIEKRAGDKLRESEERYRRLVELLPVGVAVHREGKIVYVNPAGAELIGARTPEELTGKSVFEVVHPDYHEVVRERIRRMQAGETVPPIEEKFITLSGDVIDVEVAATPIVYEGKPAMLSVVKDITERKRVEKETRRYLEELKRANRLKDLFTDILRHDLLNPVGIIRNATELLLDEFPDREELKVIMRNANRLINMIESAAKLSKLESVQELEKETLDLKEVVEKAIEATLPLFEEAGMVVENRLTEPLHIKANPIVEEVFLNLLTNAAKYAATGGRVVIDGQIEDGSIKIMVKDFGPGISDEEKERIFQRFERVDKGGVEGTGLGLAIVKRIVELHNGKVWVDDNPEGGSIFWVELPRGEE